MGSYPRATPGFMPPPGVKAAAEAYANSWTGVMSTLEDQLQITLGKVGPPRYAHFISRYRYDNNAEVRRGVAIALGSIDNEEVSVPVLTGYLSSTGENFLVRWDSSNSLVKIGGRTENPGLEMRMLDLLEKREPGRPEPSKQR